MHRINQIIILELITSVLLTLSFISAFVSYNLLLNEGHVRGGMRDVMMRIMVTD